MAAVARNVDTINQRIRRGIGERIRSERQARDWSLELVAGLAGIGRATLSQIELGQNVPQADTLMRIAASFEMTVESLLPKGYGEWLSPKALFASRSTGSRRSSRASSNKSSQSSLRQLERAA